ncbi:MAG: hypothetical protein PHR82_08350 [Endomicrobiaceae bacterium]|nr:hypothetical protein [Endomicrobiaceae bacterium]
MKSINSLILAVLSFIIVVSISTFAYSDNHSGRQKIIEIDFNLLETLNNYVTEDESDLKEIPKNIQALNGKIVKACGYLMIPADSSYNDKPLNNFAVSKNAYGCSCCTWGPPPTIFNTIMVDMKDGTSLSKPFTDMVEVTGLFVIKKEQIPDHDGGKRLGVIFYIKNAEAKKYKKSLF